MQQAVYAVPQAPALSVPEQVVPTLPDPSTSLQEQASFPTFAPKQHPWYAMPQSPGLEQPSVSFSTLFHVSICAQYHDQRVGALKDADLMPTDILPCT